MREILQRLLGLEELDARLARLEGEQTELPRRREALAQQRAERVAAMDTLQQTIAADQHRERELERALADTEAVLTRLDVQQYEVTSKAAYQALLHEMSAARQAKSRHETEILELMERVEAGQQELARLAAQAKQAEARAEEERRGLDARDAELAEQLGRVREARAERAGQLDGVILEQYERVASHRRPATVVVSGSSCPGCQIRIPPQSGVDLRSGRVLVTCESCHRILVHESLARPAA